MRRVSNRHIIEQAKAKVVVENGKVVRITEPLVKYCPLHEAMYGKKVIHTRELIKEHVERKIALYGMFTEKRLIHSKEYLVTFGASEILAHAMKNNMVDCVVQVCDSAGTVLTTRGEVVQGIGGPMGGLISTSPIKEVITKLEEEGTIVLDKKKATINQFKGVKKAFELGFQKVAVTLAGGDAVVLPKLRKLEFLLKKILYIFVVHTTGVSVKQAKLMAKYADLTWGCASKNVPQIVGPKALLQIGIGIPVFVLTKRGKEVAMKYLTDMDKPMVIHSADLPYIIHRKRPQPLL